MSADILRRAAEMLHEAVEEECPHEADSHAEGTCEVCDFAFALSARIDDILDPSGFEAHS